MSKFTGFLSDIASIIHKATIPFTFLLAIYSLLTIINQFHKPNPEISVAVASIDQITSLPQVTDLRAEFKFKGRLVRDLWRVRLRTCNSGKSTIIGEGDHKNLIHDSLPIHIDKSFDLIGFEIEQKDFQLAVSKFEPNAIQFKFLQWKTNEAFSTLLFLERKSSDRKITPEIFKCERELEKGDIIIIDASNPKNLN
ncbi:MAG TPA: hypothetical protein PKB12_05725, partial [Elusimicrobiota bacterium]|nr:hypothetical protein [Elusimicrobiota bacterium]